MNSLSPSNYSLLGAHDLLDHVLPHGLHSEPLFTLKIGDEHTNIPFLNIHHGEYQFFINNHMMMTLVAAVLVLLVFMFVAKRVRVQGEGLKAYQTQGLLGQLFEAVCAFVRDSITRPNLGPHTDKYIGYIWTIFFFVWFCNVLGLLPIGSMAQLISGDFSGQGMLRHWGGTATSNLALNIILAALSFGAVLYIGIREAGLKNFLSHFNPLGWENKKMLPIGIPLYFLEWMGLIIKCSVLALRLFGTMMAGHLVIAAFIALIFSAAELSSFMGLGVGVVVLVGCVLLLLLELFIASLQAYIFTFLTVLFISMTIGHGHDHGDDHEGHHGDGHGKADLHPAGAH